MWESTFRKLKQMNVGIYIELGGIFTMKTPDSVIDLYAAFAQAESQTHSRASNSAFRIACGAGEPF